MKKSILLLFLPFIFSFTLSAQITQEQADQIIIEHLSEINDFTLYAKADVQTGFEITTSTGEILELNYNSWVYYVNFTNEIGGKYLIVKESNGNVLEVNVKNDVLPFEPEGWKAISHSVWQCIDHKIQLSFYPSLQLLKINTTPPILPQPPHTMIASAVYTYNLVDEGICDFSLYLGTNNALVFYVCLESLVAEMELKRNVVVIPGTHIGSYYFNCVTDFKEI